MRALTVRPPWSDAIAHHGKTVENRTRPVAYRGLLAIHAGKSFDWDAQFPVGMMAAWSAPEDLPLGAIVAVADLSGCHDDQECHRESGGFCSPWAMGLSWHWELTGVRPLATPVPCKGALGLWTVPDDAEAALAAQLEEETDAH